MCVYRTMLSVLGIYVVKPLEIEGTKQVILNVLGLQPTPCV